MTTLKDEADKAVAEKATADAAEAAKGKPVVTGDEQAVHVDGTEPGHRDADKATPAEVPAIPEGGAEKFYNKETGAYNWEADAKERMFREAQADKKGEGEEKPKEGDAIESAVKAAGLDFDVIDAQIVAHGDLTEEQYAAFDSIGLDRERVKSVVDMTVDGLKQHETNVVEAFGGTEEFNKVVEWAVANLNEAEIAALDAKVNDPDQMAEGVKDIRTKMGVPPVSPGPSLKAGENAIVPAAENVGPVVRFPVL